MSDPQSAGLPAVPPVPTAGLPEPPAPLTLVCANCGQPLAGEYCAACGQRHEPHVHTLGHFAGEAFESISHADSRLWRTLLYLLTRPGFLTREFFEGRRMRYLPPFRLYLVISVLFFLVVGLGGDETGVEIRKPKTAEDVAALNDAANALGSAQMGGISADAREKIAAELRGIASRQAAELAQDAGKKPSADDDDDQKVDVMTGEGVQNGIDTFCDDFTRANAKDATPNNANRRNVLRWCRNFEENGPSAIGEGIAHNIPRAMFVFLPLLALCMKLMYWRPKRYYVEHLLFLVHNHAFVFLVMAIVMLIGMIPGVGDYAWLLYWAAFFYMAWYIYRAMRNCYRQGRGLTVLKYLTLGCLYFFAGLGVFLLTAIYSALTF